jgi:predicted anti-sigma-YlaC factor YlaD
MGAFAMALAVGFVMAAWRPDRAHGMRTIVGTVAALLVVTSVLDLLHGRTDFGDEAPHLLAVAGWLLLVHLASATPSNTVDPRWSLAPVVRVFTGRRTPVDSITPWRAPAGTGSGTAAEAARRRAG